MINLRQGRNLAAHPRAGCFRACRGIASARSRILLLLAGWLALETPLRADNPPTYLFEIDGSAVPEGFQPCAVALDSSNNVYVTDTGNNRVEKFDSGGNYLTQWGGYGSGNGQFKQPEGIAVDSSNNVYVVESIYNDRVQKFDSNGTYLTQWGISNNSPYPFPAGIAVDSSNNVYVADNGNNRVQKFDSSGNYLTQWGSYGSGNGQFFGPRGIAVDSSNNVYVTDGNDRIQKFDSDGTYLTKWGTGGSDYGQFQGVAVDSSNNVYVTDNENRVEKFTGNGRFLAVWGSALGKPGSGNGQFSEPGGIAVDSTGNYFYVADTGNLRIQVFVNNANIVPPIITQQPTNQTVPADITVTFGISVVGAAPLAFQWNANNVAVTGATNATFALTHVTPADAGTYSVLVTNSFGSVLSSSAALAVLPAFVTTQPAGGLSASGAVLNGSVTLGADETVAWFDWGTDTNYGNIAGATIVPGNNGSNNLNAVLSGLPGNFYHYRLDAANEFGIVYGNDQSFTVGFAPTATTLPSANGANGATLEAVVNPEGWETTVYFRWGFPTVAIPTLTNTTPGIDIGAGTTSLNVSSLVPSLTPSTPYKYQVVASNALGTAVGELTYGDRNQQYFLFGGPEANITLNPGAYIITAYGAPGGLAYSRTYKTNIGGLGAEMSAEFYFSTATTLTLLVGGGGGEYDGYYGGGGGGGGSFVVESNTRLVIAGGGGGGGDYYGIVRNGNVSANGSAGGGGASGYNYSGAGGAGGTAGGGGGYGIGIGVVYGGYGPPSYIYGGGGGGGFLGNGGGGYGDAGGGDSFDNGGYGGGGYYYASGGYGGGGGGGEGAPGGGGGYSGGGGGGYYGQYKPAYGGGGGSIIDSSAIAILAEVSGIASPDDPANGEIIIMTVPTPLAITTHAAFGFTNGVLGFNVIGPSGSNVVIQASSDLHTWVPLQTNLLGSGPLHFSDTQSPTNRHRFYRAQLSP